VILFKTEMVDLIRSGNKTQTRRFWRRPRVKAGSVHQVKTSYYHKTDLRIRILRVWEQPLDHMTEAEAQAEGFESWAYFMAYINKIIGKRDTIAEGRRCYAVEFELCEPSPGQRAQQ